MIGVYMMATRSSDLREKEFKNRFSRKMLNLLLDKYEQSQTFQSGRPGKQRPQIKMTKSSFNADYTDEMDFVKRQWMNEVLISLEQRQVLTLQWIKYQEFKEVDRIYLNWEMVRQSYSLSGRIPLRDKIDRLCEVLVPLKQHPWAWIVNWTVQTLAGLEQGKTMGLDVESPNEYEDIVQVLKQLPLMGEKVISLRLFSQQIFNDSKYLEKSVLKRLLSVVKQASKEHRETDEEWLDLIGLTRNPQYVHFCGSLQFFIDKQSYLTTGLLGGIGLSQKTTELMTDLKTNARRIITIENLTSYHHWIERRERHGAEELVIYTGGFPHRSLQDFLKMLSMLKGENGELIQIMHWGDIDLGGIRIFEFIKSRLIPSLKSLWMDIETLQRLEQKASTITDTYAGQIAAALEDSRYECWKPLLKYMLEQNIRLEQEAILVEDCSL